MNITEWAEEDRPREKMMANGPASLTDAELLAILIHSGLPANPKTGEPAKTAVDVARELLSYTGQSLDELSNLLLKGNTREFKGIGPAKACTIQAALELGNRIRKEQDLKKEVNDRITCSIDIFNEFNHQLSSLSCEELWAVYCSKNGKILHRHRISEGGIAFSGADIKKVLRPAIEYMASAVALCHNHPHSSIRPSQPDIQVTQQIKEALRIIDVQLLDHIIIADGKYFSFADNGMM
ncbi:MAG: DNA repair protein RadC [Bacteroidales bacterium]|nr:DNA repair protein RadC [Bacteroidales bacterium]